MDAKRENALALFPAKFRQSRERRRRRRRRRTTRRRGGDICEIPFDLAIEILMRLPAKSLMRFKCVSKQWSSLISSRNFCNRIFAVTRQEPHLYVCLVDEGGQRILLSTSPDSTCFVVVGHDLSIPGMGACLLNVVRGLMCFSVRKKACIYNPSTKQLLTLPAIKPGIIAEQGQMKHVARYYIGHDPVSDQYKLVCTIAISSAALANLKSEHWVLALEAGGSWKKVVPLADYHPHAPLSLGSSTSGSLVHYLAWLNMFTCAVVSFDIRSEELTIIHVPRAVTYVHVPALMMKGNLIEYGGKIAIFVYTYLKDKGFAELWVLEDVGENEWSHHMLVLRPCQRYLVHDIELIVKGTTQDGQVILAPSEMSSRFYFLCYDMQSNDLTRVEIKGVPPHLWFHKQCYFDLKFMDKSESFNYLET